MVDEAEEVGPFCPLNSPRRWPFVTITMPQKALARHTLLSRELDAIVWRSIVNQLNKTAQSNPPQGKLDVDCARILAETIENGLQHYIPVSWLPPDEIKHQHPFWKWQLTDFPRDVRGVAYMLCCKGKCKGKCNCRCKCKWIEDKDPIGTIQASFKMASRTSATRNLQRWIKVFSEQAELMLEWIHLDKPHLLSDPDAEQQLKHLLLNDGKRRHKRA